MGLLEDIRDILVSSVALIVIMIAPQVIEEIQRSISGALSAASKAIGKVAEGVKEAASKAVSMTSYVEECAKAYSGYCGDSDECKWELKMSCGEYAAKVIGEGYNGIIPSEEAAQWVKTIMGCCGFTATPAGWGMIVVCRGPDKCIPACKPGELVIIPVNWIEDYISCISSVDEEPPLITVKRDVMVRVCEEARRLQPYSCMICEVYGDKAGKCWSPGAQGKS